MPAEAAEFVIGDLDEEYLRLRYPRGAWRARGWYWSQAVRSISHTRKATDMVTLSTPPPPVRPGAVIRELSIALRSLRRAPGYAAAAILTLGLGVGGATAIFSAVNDALLRPLPYADSGRLAMLWEANQERGWTQVEAAPANLFDWRERSSTLSDIGFVNPYAQAVSLMTQSGPARVAVAQVSGNFFSIMGVPPLVGRTFREEETFEPGIAMLSYQAWRNHFSADPDVVGSVIRLDGQSYAVIGVMGESFAYPFSEADVWTTPAPMASRRRSIWWRQAHVVKPIGRLAPGSTFDQASAELARIAADLEREHPDTNKAMEAGLTPLKTYLAGDRRSTLLLLLGAVGVLQLIACANVANLMLGRALGREQELAVRAALGASRRRLVAQVLTESLILSAAGTGVGLVVGLGGLRAITAVSPDGLAGLTFHLDWRLFAFTSGLCVLSAVLAGLWPALRSARVDPARHIQDGARGGTAGSRRLLAANAFVTFEVALAVLLVAAAGLLIRSLDQLRRIDLGVDIRNVLTFQVHPSTGAFRSDDARVRFADDLASRLSAVPGVEQVGVGRGAPLTGYGWTSDFTIFDWDRDQFGVEARHREATADYFSALKVPVIEGRLFEPSDLAEGAPIPVVVNQAFAERYFPGSSPVGHRIVFDRVPTDRSYWYPIVGVVGNERRDLITEPVPEVIAHLKGDTPSTLTFIVRTTVAPLSVVPDVRAALAELDPEAPLLSPRTMEQVAADARAPERFMMTLFGVFALAALLLAAIGVYGVASQAARVRTREVGIRLALGASGSTVVRELVTRGVAFWSLGLAGGVVGALALGHLLETQLYRVTTTDPLTLVVVVVLMGGVALFATVWPTWRATRVDPVSVLRVG